MRFHCNNTKEIAIEVMGLRSSDSPPPFSAGSRSGKCVSRLPLPQFFVTSPVSNLMQGSRYVRTAKHDKEFCASPIAPIQLF